jgi:hypothetical protein
MKTHTVKEQRESGFPPQHLEALRNTHRWAWRSILVCGGGALFLSWGYFHGWPTPLFELAPFAALIALLVCFVALGSLSDIRTVALLPYFKKGGEKIEADTFLHGKALARYCVPLDTLAQQAGIEPLSAFGFTDDLAGQKVVWHDAARGLVTVTGLIELLQETPTLLPTTAQEVQNILNDLDRVEDSLRSAVAHQVLFCFVLRHGNCASGHEMDVRQGYFL